jgi:hypothetical protein
MEPIVNKKNIEENLIRVQIIFHVLAGTSLSYVLHKAHTSVRRSNTAGNIILKIDLKITSA